MIKIAPSILSADFGNMARDIEMLNRAGVDYVHCDVMDGMFVPNMTFGFQMISAVKKVAAAPLDVHLMIEQPERYVERFAEAGSDIISVHVEATNHLQRTLKQISGCGVKAAAVLNPATPLETLKYVMDDVDLILLMSVNPGYGGQSFIPAVLGKITELRKMITATGKDIELEIDGGVTFDNCKTIIDAGANVLVAGSAVFNAEDPVAAVSRLRG
ncbi:MAG: ribulose-phosphate 3-epimerase [Christensenella sp.]|uniref:ribulose-phosphate 3-epimerase n=1 Tax=Christensenella sp. TaxID=1935934 RepID=UPI002B20A549|nr:ribulose-phosphate 3-epimerase [Christensenella sp.]MEA5004667.1 ribulose-phosphate 3-epimerase [Christensenella sp.]